MKPENTSFKLSHIALFVEKSTDIKSICAFRTNTQKYNSKIWFTYYLYNNKEEGRDDFDDLIKKAAGKSNENELFIISDDSVILQRAGERNIACAGLLTDDNRHDSFAGVLYLIEDIENIRLPDVDRMWRRCRKIPWIIGQVDNLLIREMEEADVEDLYIIYDDEAVKYTEPLYENHEDEREYVRNYIHYQYELCEFGVWIIEDAQSHEIVGRAGLSMREGFDEPELGYVIGRKFRRRGYGTRICDYILKYAKEELELGSVGAMTLRSNLASAALLDRLGFNYEHEWEINGQVHDYYKITLL